MNTDGISKYLMSTMRNMGMSIYLPTGNEFADRLKLGDVISGRVLQHYEGSRYLIYFSGQEKVVDSTIRLKINELLFARVVATGDRVEMQRVAGNTKDTIDKQLPDDNLQPLQFGMSRQEQMLERLLQKYQVVLNGSERSTLLTQVRNSSQPTIMAMAGLVLAKLGLPQQSSLLPSFMQ